MKFTCLQQDLWPALQAVSRCCGVRSQLPVLGNILFSSDKGRLKLSATNLEIGVVKSVKADMGEEGEITIPAKTILEIVSNLSGEKIEFSATDGHLEVQTTSFSSKINGISASEFPTIPLTGKQAASVEAQILAKALPQVAFAAAVEEGRPVLTAVLMEIKDKKLQLVATDGYRLAQKQVGIEDACQFKTLVPRRTLEEVLRLITDSEAKEVKISTSDDQNQIIFSLGDSYLSSRLIEGQFPAWEKIIPTSIKARIIVDRADLLQAVRLASVFSKSEANVVKLQNLPDKLVLTSEAKELGSQKKEIAATSEGEEITIAFNTKFLLDILAAVGSSQIIIELSGNLSAAMVKPMGEEGLSYIVMPVNLS